MYIKRTISIPEELAKEAEIYLVGKYYGNLSEVIRDGIRQLVNEYKQRQDIESVTYLYKEGRISLRDAADLLDLPLRETLKILSGKKSYIRYGEKELTEDIQ